MKMPFLNAKTKVLNWILSPADCHAWSSELLRGLVLCLITTSAGALSAIFFPTWDLAFYAGSFGVLALMVWCISADTLAGTTGLTLLILGLRHCLSPMLSVPSIMAYGVIGLWLLAGWLRTFRK